MDCQFRNPILLAYGVLVAFFDDFALLGPLNSGSSLSQFAGEHSIFSLDNRNILQSSGDG